MTWCGTYNFFSEGGWKNQKLKGGYLRLCLVQVLQPPWAEGYSIIFALHRQTTQPHGLRMITNTVSDCWAVYFLTILRYSSKWEAYSAYHNGLLGHSAADLLLCYLSDCYSALVYLCPVPRHDQLSELICHFVSFHSLNMRQFYGHATSCWGGGVFCLVLFYSHSDSHRWAEC